MKRTIENIWKEQPLEIPQVKGLYQRKSKIAVARIQQTQKWDNRGLWLLAALTFGGFAAAGFWYLAVYSALVLMALYFYNIRMIRSLAQVQFNESVQQYLKHYLQVVHKMVRHYSRLLFWGVPLTVLPALSWWLHRTSADYGQFIESEPWYFIAGIYAAVGFVLGIYGWGMYRLVTQLMYGSKLRQLKEIKADMENLSK